MVSSREIRLKEETPRKWNKNGIIFNFRQRKIVYFFLKKIVKQMCYEILLNILRLLCGVCEYILNLSLTSGPLSFEINGCKNHGISKYFFYDRCEFSTIPTLKMYSSDYCACHKVRFTARATTIHSNMLCDPPLGTVSFKMYISGLK